MDARALTLVPVAAAELLDGAVDLRQELDMARAALREKGAGEGDTSLSHQLAIWRHRAEVNGERQALAERALRALRGHWVEARAEIAAWQDATNQSRSIR